MHSNASHISAAVAALSSVASTWYSGLGIPVNKRTDVAPGIELRIMPLGASITYGIGSSNGNGYRLALAEDLTGTTMRFVGSVRSGTMTDNYNEGHPGATIRETAQFARASLGYRPNVITLHVGTNDFDSLVPKEATEEAPERLGGLIDDLVVACPDATVLVAQLAHAANPLYDERIRLFNDQVPRVVAKRANAGHRVLVADMRSITKQYLNGDGIHPTDVGYKMMADIWFAGIKTAHAKGWIQRPIGADPLQPLTTTSKSKVNTGAVSTKKRKCRQEPSLHPVNKGQPLTDGLGHNGLAKFNPKWLQLGQVSKGRNLKPEGIHFADLNGDGRADYLWVNPKTSAVIAYLNTGRGTTQSWAPVNQGKYIASVVGGTGDGVFFADLNGDGRADYIYVYKSGKVVWWRNDGPSAPGWKWHGPTELHIGASHATQNNVVFADINGDGRDDFLIKDPKGGLELWLNIGNSHNVDTFLWTSSGKITSPGWNIAHFALADIDGDGRDDYLVWDKDGGLSGFSMFEDQKKASHTGSSNHQSLSRKEYIIHEKNGAVDLYINHGGADTTVAGDGIRFADLNGDGMDDYMFIDLHGKITVYLNSGAQAKAKHGWSWVAQNHAKPIASGAGASRPQIHLADIDGDGKADFLAVHDNGAVYCWLNGGEIKRPSGGWYWFPQGQIASGIGAGPGVRFADMDGDGKADLVWLGKYGSVTVWLNKATVAKGTRKIKTNWVKENAGKAVGLGVGAFRKDVQLADIDGDGRADYIWIHPADGSVSVWINQIGDKHQNWMQYKTRIATGVGSAGANILFAYIDHNEWADYVVVNPQTGDIRVWASSCSNLAPLSPAPKTPAPQNPPLPRPAPLPILPPLPPLSPFRGSPVGSSAPGTPSVPGIPGNPGNPNIPGVPGTPGSPGSPGTPETPGTPGTPGGRGSPGDPNVPSVPATPGTSGTPGIPGGQESPANPSKPDVSGAPGTPGTPGSPGSPGTPGGPSSPGNPGSPESSGTPGGSGGPDTSGGAPGAPGTTGTPAEDKPANETPIVGVTIPGVLTLGTPTILPGLLPTCGSSTINGLVPLAVQISQLFNDTRKAAIGVSDGHHSCKDLSPTKDALSKTFTALALLAGKVKQTDATCLIGPDQLLVQGLRARLPQLLGEVRLALSHLFGSCSSNSDATPDDATIQTFEQSLSEGNGAIGQLVGPALEPLISQSGRLDPSAAGNSGGNGGPGGGPSPGSGEGSGGGSAPGSGGSSGGASGGSGGGSAPGSGGSSGGGSGSSGAGSAPGSGGSSGGGSGSSGGGSAPGSGGSSGGGSGGSGEGSGDGSGSAGGCGVGKTELHIFGARVCLPKSGPPSINFLRQYASLVSNALGSAERGITSLAGGGSGLSLGDVSSVADLFTTVSQDASDLAAAGESIELSSFGGGEVTDIINLQDGLNNLRDLLKGDLSDITKFITNPPGGLKDFKRIAAQFGAGGTIVGLTGVSLNYIIHYGDQNSNKDNNNNGGQQTTATATATASTNKATPTSWLLNTVRGTSRETFEDFVGKLPDRGKGERIIFPRLNYQNYLGKMSLEEAKAVSKNPIVDQIGANDPMENLDIDLDELPQSPDLTRRLHHRRSDEQHLDRRVNPRDIVYQKHSPLHLRMISRAWDKKVVDLNEYSSDVSTEYTYNQNTGGRGTYVYVLDLGFDFEHPELRSSWAGSSYLATGIRDSNGIPDVSMADTRSHGTGVASMAIGRTLGVAKSAELIGVKFNNNFTTTDPWSILRAWQWVMDDVIAKGRQGKAVINLSSGFRYLRYIDNSVHVDYRRLNIINPRQHDFFLPLLADAWDSDVVTVISAGNVGGIHLGDLTPHRYGRPDNPLITVGSLTLGGSKWFEHTPVEAPTVIGVDPSLTGSLSAWAQGERVKVARPYLRSTPFTYLSGSSYAAPQVAGLAAYFLSEPRGVPLTAMQIKEKIVSLSRTAQAADAPGLIYNGVRALCGQGGPSRKSKPRGLSVRETTRVKAARQINPFLGRPSAENESLALDLQSHRVKSSTRLNGPFPDLPIPNTDPGSLKYPSPQPRSGPKEPLPHLPAAPRAEPESSGLQSEAAEPKSSGLQSDEAAKPKSSGLQSEAAEPKPQGLLSDQAADDLELVNFC
ncbi:hypothetical protein MMC07_005974 [Pseudocyphellaria aurata]|nr:hypothetical protein [Pseudocyphellaria aurata]